MYIGLLTTDKSGPVFEFPALKAAGKLQLPVLWSTLQCCLNFFLFLCEGKDGQKQAASSFVEVGEILLHSSGQVKDATTSANFPENK